MIKIKNTTVKKSSQVVLKKCVLRDEKLKLKGKILNQHLFRTISTDVPHLTQLNKEQKYIVPAYLKVLLPMLRAFRLWWVQVVASPSCMIVQIRIPCKILRMGVHAYGMVPPFTQGIEMLSLFSASFMAGKWGKLTLRDTDPGLNVKHLWPFPLQTFKLHNRVERTVYLRHQ